MAKGGRNWRGMTCIRGRPALAATDADSNSYIPHDPTRSLPSVRRGYESHEVPASHDGKTMFRFATRMASLRGRVTIKVRGVFFGSHDSQVSTGSRLFVSPSMQGRGRSFARDRRRTQEGLQG